ncbi:hypothetical protein [uncultured Bradyrhizobium sp.]|uniref:hypothetical protein n=1 Tax=Bradyrhizobium sp. SK17 TaxID=2057741 RepID=UPI00288A4749|nr:hypothetical protein [uncultured Bradyrhizobium sp.]
MIDHGQESYLERLPARKPVLPRDQLLRITQLEAVREDVGIGHLAEAGQAGPDLGGDRMIAITVPAQDQLGLFAKVFEIGHGRSYG